MLTDLESYGGRAEEAIDVVVPDLPGYGFHPPYHLCDLVSVAEFVFI
jgi:hypothetical protein